MVPGWIREPNVSGPAQVALTWCVVCDAEILELLDDAEPAARRLDAADRLVARLLVVAPRPGLAADGQRLDALDDRVVRIDVAVEPAHFAVGDDIDARLLHVTDGGVGGVVEHLVHVARAEVALLERLDRREPPARFSVRADDRGRDQGQSHRERPPIIRETLGVTPGVVRPAAEDDLAALDDVEPGGVLGHVVDVGLGDEDRAAEPDDRRDAGAHGRDDRGRESLERLVEQQHLRVERQRARDREHLALAAAHLRALARGVAAERGKHVVRLLDALGRRPTARPRPGGDLDVLGDGEIREDPGVFGRPAEPEHRDLVGAPAVDGPAAELDGAGPGPEVPHDRPESRRLARRRCAPPGRPPRARRPRAIRRAGSGSSG